MNLFEAIMARQSVRAYKPQQVEQEKIDAIVAAINQAPSAGNLQAYRVWLIRGAAIKERLAQAALDQKFLASAPLLLVFWAEPARASQYGKRGAELYCVQDATIAVAYAQLAATALGLATCWIGAFDEAAVAEVLGSPEGLRPIAMLPIGYAAEKPASTPRRAVSELFVERSQAAART